MVTLSERCSLWPVDQGPPILKKMGGVKTMQTNLRLGLNTRPSLQAAAATQREQRLGSA